MNIAEGNKHIFGFKIGILMLEAAFPRIPGDIGNAWTFPFPVLYKVVSKSPTKVVGDLQDEDLKPFVEAAKELEENGCSAITTGCGFLAMFQKKIASELKVPFFSSNLLMIPFISSMLPPDKIVGVMTVNKSTLSDRHFAGIGAVDIPKVIYGMETEEEFTSMIMEDRSHMDVVKCREEHIRVAKKMVAEHPEVGAIILECTNMPPFAKDIQKATGLPVFDIVGFIQFIQGAFDKPAYTGMM